MEESRTSVSVSILNEYQVQQAILVCVQYSNRSAKEIFGHTGVDNYPQHSAAVLQNDRVDIGLATQPGVA